MIFTAGIVGWDEQESFPEYTLHGQFARALRNTLQILAEDGAGPQHIVRMTCYVTDRHEYMVSRDEIGAAWQRDHGRELSGDGAGRGEGPGRKRRQGRDRDDGGGRGMISHEDTKKERSHEDPLLLRVFVSRNSFVAASRRWR